MHVYRSIIPVLHVLESHHIDALWVKNWWLQKNRDMLQMYPLDERAELLSHCYGFSLHLNVPLKIGKLSTELV